MELLRDFERKNFSEQIKILQTIEQDNLRDAVDDLCRLMMHPLQNDSVDFMVQETLHRLLLDQDQKLLEGLRSGSRRLQRLCIRVAGERRLAAAGPVLEELAGNEGNADLLLDILDAIAKLQSPAYRHLFMRHATSTNTLIAALSIEMLMPDADEQTLALLCRIVEDAQADEHWYTCSIAAAQAIKALGALNSEQALAFLCSKLYHRNPGAQRLIHEQVIKKGPRAVAEIGQIFSRAEVHLQIMSARVLGFIADQRGADILIDSLAVSPPPGRNLEYAIYEALGRIGGDRAIGRLLEGLQQEDTFLLMAVITGLERLACALIIERLRELLAAESARSARIIETIAAARAVNLFDGLYQDERIGKALIAAIARLNDADVIADFYMWLQSRGDERSFADSDILEHAIIQDTERRMLAADDSLAMLQFYRTVAADLGMDITTVQSFGAALEELKKAGAGGYCLVIADMHLHDMDSMEFVRAVRDTLRLRDMSIIMAATAVEERQMKLFRQTGVTDFIRKPCEPDAVKRILLASLAAG